MPELLLLSRLVSSVIALVTLAGVSLADEIVLSAFPAVQIESSVDSTSRRQLSESESKEYQVIIIKRGDHYVWLSREGRVLLHRQSGANHYFIDKKGGGYIKVFDQSFLPEFLQKSDARFQYFEQLSVGMSTITYWGTADGFSP